MRWILNLFKRRPSLDGPWWQGVEYEAKWGNPSAQALLQIKRMLEGGDDH